MAYSYADIFQSEAERIDSEHAAAVAEMEAARLNEEPDRVRWASKTILALDAERANLIARANNWARPAQAAPMAGAEDLSHQDVALCRQFGLQPSDLKVAKGWTGDPNMSDADKVKTYVENRQRYRQARQSGEYRDDQGRVTR
jgi:hypothetical protein